MKWKKLGLAFNPAGKFSWAENYALQPTPLFINDVLRVFIGVRDLDGVSRIGYVDLNPENPLDVLGFSESPILDIGKDGAFDEFGVVPSAVYREGNKIHLYYAGYQRGLKARFIVLGGLAISDDNGQSFKRYSNVPVFERTSEELLFRVPHTVLKDGNIFKFWYGGGSEFKKGQSKTLPLYDIRYLESKDGIEIPDTGKSCIKTEGDEYRLGRPNVIRLPDKSLRMFYGYSTEGSAYKLGFADSNEGLSWIRKDNELDLPLSDSGWDSEMMAYPSVVSHKDKTYMLYNGNNYGIDGFGIAELLEW